MRKNQKDYFAATAPASCSPNRCRNRGRERLIWVAIVIIPLLAGCSASGGSGGGGSTGDSTWDQMKWDQGKWG